MENVTDAVEQGGASARRWGMSMSKLKSKTKKPKTNTNKFLRDWHKRAGLFAFVFMGWLGVSGVLLNQSASWGLDAMRVDKSWLMSVYGLYPVPPESGFSDKEHWATATLEHTLVNGHSVSVHLQHPIGFVADKVGDRALLYLANQERLLILSAQGDVVDDLASGASLPVKTIRRMGLIASTADIVVQDLDMYATKDGLGWRKISDSNEIVWSSEMELTNSQREIATQYSKPSMPLEQILIDAHSGRIFGKYGASVINAVGIAALWLSVSGVWMYWRANNRNKNRGK
jgi:hypothetical protein